MKHYVVIGAGISGLATAWFLKQRFGNSAKITVLEKEGRVGGWIKTVQQGEFLFDTGPRSCRTRGSGRASLQLFAELGLQNEVIPCSSDARNRYLYTRGKLQKLPSSLLGALFSPLTRPFLPLLWKERNIPASDLEEETIAAWITRRFSRAFAEELFDPLTLGIYAGDIHSLSFPACFPEFSQAEKQHGSLIRSLWQGKSKKTHPAPIITLRKGMETLTTCLGLALKEQIQLETPVLAMSAEANVRTNRGELAADHVYLCTPAHAIPHFVPSLTDQLKTFSAATVACVHFGWDEPVLTKQGFGYLVPTKEKEPILGVIFDSSAFPEQNQHDRQTRLTVMLGGSTGIPVSEIDDDALIEVSKMALKKHLGITKIPAEILVSRASQAIPQYTMGHQKRVAALKHEIDRLFQGKVTLMGSAWQGVSVNDCIHEAHQCITDSTR